MSTITTSSTLSLDTVFYILSDCRKRYVLYALHRAEGNSLSVHQLATKVHSMEQNGSFANDGSPTQVADDLRKQRLPELAMAGVVEYDERSETARYHRMPSLEEWLEHAEFKEGKHPRP